MMRRALIAGILVAGVIAGSAPALAVGHVCIAATDDPNDPGPSVICIWTPEAPR